MLKITKETVDTISFLNQEGDIEYTVKRTFLDKFKDHKTPADFNDLQLINDYALPLFLHNTVGPSVVIVENKLCEYWVDGVPLSEEEARRIENSQSIQSDIKASVNE